MKKTHIIALAIVGLAIAMIASTYGDASTYMDFENAKKNADNGNLENVHIVGSLKKDALGNPMDLFFDDKSPVMELSFSLVDDKGETEYVTFYDLAKPMEIERSEKVVVIGHYENGKFKGEEILLKCPSKYENTEL